LQRIAREGKRIRTTHLEVRAAASPLARSGSLWTGLRIGLVVPRFKHSAVARNQLKRRLRELARLEMLPTEVIGDVVIRIRPDAYEASFDVLAIDIRRAIDQLRRWRVSSDAAATQKPSETE
jgi:ribonuclease P protein component